MKWLFIIALLLNISFYAYNVLFPQEVETKKAVSTSTEKKQMVLLSELNADELKVLQAKKVPERPVPPPPVQTIQTEDGVADTSVPQNQSIESPNDAQAQPKSTVTVSKPKVCYSLGPFNKKKMDEIRLILEKQYQNQLSFDIQTTSAITYYRIYIPPLENKKERNKTLELLDNSGMKDHYVMSIDGRKNAIALGVFKKRSAAESIAEKANNIGLSTTIEAISDDKDSLYRLQLEFQDKADLEPYNKLISKMKLESKKC